VGKFCLDNAIVEGVFLFSNAQTILENEGIGTRVVSMPCWELFEKQDRKYQRKVLTSSCLTVAIEAASPMGWDKWLHAGWRKNKNNFFIGMNDFGASAPAPDLYKYFGITPENIVNKIKDKLI
jgi:transketolase